jgi:hypothetical protein
VPNEKKGDVVPDPDSVKFEAVRRYGLSRPSFMSKSKRRLYRAQGRGAAPHPGQADTHIYFAGSNTTADSLEHAFSSGMVIASYAFNVAYPLAGHADAWGMYELFHREFMFPKTDVSSRLAQLHPRYERAL